MSADAILPALGSSLPAWLLFPVIGADSIAGFAAPPGTRWARKALDVTIYPNRDTASIRETRPDQLPQWCPELHLNNDRTFCLGLHPQPVTDEETARQWWADVEIHLKLLSVALGTGVWPQHSALDHGKAGALQWSARRLADRLGLAEDFARARAEQNSWIGDFLFERVGRDGALGDASCPCPMRCAGNRKRVFSMRRCPRRRKMTRLILLERARRISLQAFWDAVGETGQQCCGRMRDCPLARDAATSHDAELLAATYRALRRIEIGRR